MKPLLQVTRQDEEIQAREAQLQKAKDKLSKLELDFTELDKKNQQVTISLIFVVHVGKPKEERNVFVWFLHSSGCLLDS